MGRLARLSRCVTCFPGYGLFWGTLLYGGVAVAVEFLLPQCLVLNQDDSDEDTCLQDGVDNSTSTIVTGFLTSTWMFELAMHLWSIKCFYMPRWDPEIENFSNEDHRGNIRPSGIHALFWNGVAILLQTLARLLQPNPALGQTLYWSLMATSFPTMAFSVYAHGYFAMRSIQRRLRICCSCLISRVGFTVGTVLTCAMLIFGAGISCAVLDPEDDDVMGEDATATSTALDDGTTVVVTSELAVNDNVFAHNEGGSLRRLTQRWLQEPTANTSNTTAIQESDIPYYDMEHVCQDISYYGNYAFLFVMFFFWYALSKVLRKSARRQDTNSNNGSREEPTHEWGMSTLTATMLVPWVSFSVGTLYPVWVWLASDFSNHYWLEIAVRAKSGVIYHYGQCLLAMLAHNWFRTLTYRNPDNAYFSEEVFHDLTWGVFEKKNAEESLFHDLTFGVFEPASKNQSSATASTSS